LCSQGFTKDIRFAIHGARHTGFWLTPQQGRHEGIRQRLVQNQEGILDWNQIVDPRLSSWTVYDVHNLITKGGVQHVLALSKIQDIGGRSRVGGRQQGNIVAPPGGKGAVQDLLH
jgi:hypothetical protein